MFFEVRMLTDNGGALSKVEPPRYLCGMGDG